VIRKVLTSWREEPELAALREPNLLKSLPAEEREDCLALWNEVRIMLTRVEPPK
jgi:hypothetical protein